MTIVSAQMGEGQLVGAGKALAMGVPIDVYKDAARYRYLERQFLGLSQVDGPPDKAIWHWCPSVHPVGPTFSEAIDKLIESNQ